MRVAHGVVGYMQPEYIRNAIDSVLHNRLADEFLFVLVTRGSKKHFSALRESYDKEDNFNASYIEHVPGVESSLKTGSLYQAYNILMSECVRLKVDHLNLIQSDFQLIYWNQEIIDRQLNI